MADYNPLNSNKNILFTKNILLTKQTIQDEIYEDVKGSVMFIGGTLLFFGVIAVPLMTLEYFIPGALSYFPFARG